MAVTWTMFVGPETAG